MFYSVTTLDYHFICLEHPTAGLEETDPEADHQHQQRDPDPHRRIREVLEEPQPEMRIREKSGYRIHSEHPDRRIQNSQNFIKNIY